LCCTWKQKAVTKKVFCTFLSFLTAAHALLAALRVLIYIDGTYIFKLLPPDQLKIGSYGL